MRKVGLFLISLYTVFLCCAGLENIIKPPNVKVENVSLKDVSFQDMTLDFNLLVVNPNAFGASFNGFDYELFIEDNQFLAGDNQQGFQVAANGSSDLKIPLSLKFSEIQDMIRAVADKDSLSYRLSGHLRPAGILTGFEFPFRTSGRLPNVRLPKISLSKLQISKLDFSGVQLELAIGVDNPNGFGFDVGQFSYQIDLAGQKLASGQTEQLGSIQNNGRGELILPISIGFAQAAGSLRSVLVQENRATVNLQGSAGIKTPFGQMKLPFNVSDPVNILR
jgi:LEA14-like dessication related protein